MFIYNEKCIPDRKVNIVLGLYSDYTPSILTIHCRKGSIFLPTEQEYVYQKWKMYPWQKSKTFLGFEYLYL